MFNGSESSGMSICGIIGSMENKPVRSGSKDIGQECFIFQYIVSFLPINTISCIPVQILSVTKNLRVFFCSGWSVYLSIVIYRPILRLAFHGHGIVKSLHFTPYIPHVQNQFYCFGGYQSAGFNDYKFSR